MTKFEEDFEQMEIAFDEDKLELYDYLKVKFIEKYDPEKQPKPTDVQTEVINKTTQFDTLDNPTHIIHPLGRGELDFEVKNFKNSQDTNIVYWEKNNLHIAKYYIDQNKLIFKNPFKGFLGEFLTDFNISNLVLNLSNE